MIQKFVKLYMNWRKYKKAWDCESLLKYLKLKWLWKSVQNQSFLKREDRGGVAIQINAHFGGLLLAVGIIKKQVLCWKKRPLLADTHSHFILQFSVRFEFPGENAVSLILHHGDWLDFVDKFYSAIEMNLTSTTPCMWKWKTQKLKFENVLGIQVQNTAKLGLFFGLGLVSDRLLAVMTAIETRFYWTMDYIYIISWLIWFQHIAHDSSNV